MSSDTFQLEVTVNGKPISRTIPTTMRLLDFLREELNLTGAKLVCGEGECGACTVFLNGKTVNSCLIFAVEAHGGEITTIEGLGNRQQFTPLQQAFIEAHAVQCGYCIPGMILSAEYLLQQQPHPDRNEIREALVGNICRCTGYQKIIDAVELCAERRQE